MIQQPVSDGDMQDEPYIADFTQLQIYQNALGLSMTAEQAIEAVKPSIDSVDSADQRRQKE